MDINLLLVEWEPIEDNVSDRRGGESESEDDSSEAINGGGNATETVVGTDDGPMAAGTEYLNALENDGGITLLQEAKIRRAYEQKGVLELFTLFFSCKIRDTLLQWLNPRLHEKGVPGISMRELNGYIGLEIATSLCPLKSLRDYWATDNLYGQELFRTTTKRDLFLEIRAAVTLHPVDTVPEEVNLKDPLWHCQSIFNDILKKCASFAVPRGVSALDESSVRTKARSAARTYIPSKPDKYAVRFYALVDWKTLYVHGLFDTGSGNTTVEGHLERYTSVFPQMRRPMTTKCTMDGLDPHSASALWVAMLSRQHQQLPAPSGKRVVVMDSFYTRHALAKHILSMMAGEIRVLGTCRLKFVDALSKPAVEAAVLDLKNAAHGAWKLVAAIDIVGGTLKEAEKTHKKTQKKLKVAERTPFVPNLFRSPHAGFIVFRDKKVVVFYTNDSAFTTSADVLEGNTTEAQECCNGMAIVQRWTGSEVFRRTNIRVPVGVAAYNKFMNAIDRFDQLRSSNPTRRREWRLQMSVFTWLLDVASAMPL